jgi:myo-inositol-1(or 4)-monophosphatase
LQHTKQGTTLNLKELISITREAGDALAKNFGNKYLSKVIGVGDSGDVTIGADDLSEKIVLKRLRKVGNIEVMSEEAGHVVYGKPKYRVILDPLDGSSNYKRNIPLFSVSIGVQTIPDLKPTMATVYEPMNRKMFSAEKGKGAFLNGSKIHPNQDRPFQDCLFDLDLHTAAEEKRFIRLVEAFRKFGVSLKSFRSVGSCAISLAYTASGTLDGFLDFTKNSRMVDVAAGLLILEEAGGVATDIQGNPITEAYDSVIACSSEQHNRKIRELLLD